MDQLRRARHRLHRAALPELRLSPAIRALLRTEQRLARPLRVAICGEVNAGKSSLANLLAGIESLPTAVTANTLVPTLLYYAAEPEIWAVQGSGKRERLRGNGSLPRQAALRLEVGLPSPRLAAMQILDLPGFSDSRSGAPVVDPAAHHVDATIWCTVSTQAWKESERSAWSMLSPRLGARSLLVATHKDSSAQAGGPPEANGTAARGGGDVLRKHRFAGDPRCDCRHGRPEGRRRLDRQRGRSA